MSAEAYATMIDRAQGECHFLWDALKDALVLELKEGEQDLIVELCNLPGSSRAKREMLTEALTEYGSAWPDKGRELVGKLMQEARHMDAALVSIEVAYNLGQFDVLEQMAQHKEGTVRRTAARFIHYVWRESPARAFSILERLAARVRKRLLPNLRVLDSCLSTSALILMEGYGNLASVETLRKTWIRILDKVLYRDWDDIAIIGSIIRWVRESVLRLVSYGVWYGMARVWQDDPMGTYDRKDLERFFRRDPETRLRFARLVPYIDVSSSDLEGTWDDFVAVLQRDDLLSILLMILILTAHGLQYDDEVTSAKTNPTISYIKKLFDYAVELRPARPAIPYLLMSLTSTGRGYRAEGIDEDFLTTIESCLRKYYEKHGCVSRNDRGHEWKVTGFGFYVQLYYIKDANLDSRFLAAIVQDALEHGSCDFLRRYIRDVADVSHPGQRKTWALLRGLQPILTELKGVGNEEMRFKLETDLVRVLSRVRIYAPREVDQFLDILEEQGEILGRIRRRVQASEREEAVGLMLLSRGVWFIRDAILLNPNKFLLSQLAWWFGQSAEYRNAASWLSVLLRLLVNLMYLPDNESVFKTPSLLSEYRKGG